jgi:hypothetical protein
MADGDISDADVGLAPTPDTSATPAATAAPVATAPAPGAEGRQVTVRPRAPAKPPPAPIEPHKSEPLAVAPVGVPVDAVGQKPPLEESDADLGITPPSKQSSTMGDVGKSAWSGLAEGTEGLLGAARDLPNLADYGAAWAGAHVNQALGGENAQHALERTHGSVLRQAIGDDAYNALGEINPLPSSATLKALAVKSGLDPNYQPQTGLGRYAHEIAAFAPAALIPGLGEAGVGARLAQTVAPAVGSEFAGNMAKGTSLEPWARGAGALLGGGAGILGGQTARAVNEFRQPLTEAGQQDLAASQFRAQTSDPDAALAKLRAARTPGAAPGENIPGSQPTTAQITGDMRQAGMERAAQLADPEGHAERMSAQRAAQTNAIKNIQPTGAPENVADLITKRLADIDAQHDAEMELQRGVHETTRQNLEQQARNQTGAVARQADPEQLGQAARRPLVESMAKAKASEQRLWEAIDKHKIGVWSNQVGARARNIASKIGMQKPPTGEEAAILQAAGSMPRWTKLADLMDLTSRLKAEMRNERFTNGSTPALKRMTELLKTSENVIKNAATRQSAAEAKAEMEGLRRMTPEDRAKMQAARMATKARGDIERSPAGAIARKGATSESFRTMDSQVPGKVFAAGPTGAQKLKAYTAAGGTMDPVHDIVADSLAREATTDGMIDANKLQRWQAKYSDALGALPEQVRNRFVGSPGAAQQALAEGAAARREALIAHTKTDFAKAVGKSPSAQMRADPAIKALEGQTSPRDVQRIIGGLFDRRDAVSTLDRLRNTVAHDPVAADGLKRAALDHVIERVMSETEAGTTGVKSLKPGMTQKFIRENRPALKAAGLDDRQLGALDAISADIERQQRFHATRVAGQSNTPQDLFKHLKAHGESGGHGMGPLGNLIALREGIEVAHKMGVPHGLSIPAGIGAAVSSKLVGSARNAGLKNVADIIHNAVMHPDQAEQLLSRAPKARAEESLSQKLRRQAMYAGLAAMRGQSATSPQN